MRSGEQARSSAEAESVTERVLEIIIVNAFTIIIMLNIVGERERPNLGFAHDVWAA